VATGLHNFDPKLKAADVSGSARIKAIVGDGDKKTLLVEYEFTATSKKTLQFARRHDAGRCLTDRIRNADSSGKPVDGLL